MFCMLCNVFIHSNTVSVSNYSTEGGVLSLIVILQRQHVHSVSVYNVLRIMMKCVPLA